MRLDVGTLFVTCFAGCAVLGVLMLLSWWQNREARSLAWWGAAYLLGAAGVLLLAARGRMHPFVTIDLATGLLIAGYGLLWIGVRCFNRRPLPLLPVAGIVLVWLAGCRVPGFHDDPTTRGILSSILIAILTLASAHELWRSRDEPLASRYPATAVFALNGLAFVARIVASDSLSFPPMPEAANTGFSLFALETLLFSIASAFTLVAMTKERAEVAQRRAATIDPLTGVFNRRAFFDRAERMLQRAAVDGTAVAVLIFDLDHFKDINDRYGHPAGDSLLVEFASLVTTRLRSGDLFGRLGGEEFAAVLPGATNSAAIAAAERIRTGFAATIVDHGGRQVTTTVSVGVTTASVAGADIDRLIAGADRALYRAKRAGRDTVEVEA